MRLACLEMPYGFPERKCEVTPTRRLAADFAGIGSFAVAQALGVVERYADLLPEHCVSPRRQGVGGTRRLDDEADTLSRSLADFAIEHLQLANGLHVTGQSRDGDTFGLRRLQQTPQFPQIGKQLITGLAGFEHFFVR